MGSSEFNLLPFYLFFMRPFFHLQTTKTAAECIKDEEYDCEDQTCINTKLECNGRVNCRFRWDEDEAKCNVSNCRPGCGDSLIAALKSTFCSLLSFT